MARGSWLLFGVALIATVFICLFSYKGYSRALIEVAQTGCPTTKQKGGEGFYSQNYEDFILSIVFSDVEKGRYVDVGANDPKKNSVTAHFYKKGWHGINVEPLPSLFAALTRERPLDVNINVGVGDEEGLLTFYQVSSADNDLGLSTFVKKSAMREKAKGFKVEEMSLPITTLNKIFSKHPLPIINFLNMDIEGYEKKALLGLNLSKYRPEVFVIEAREPLTLKSSHEVWEPILLEHHYKFVMSDGLNRYYLAEEKNDLKPKFFKARVCMAIVSLR